MNGKDILEMASNVAVGFSSLTVALLGFLGLNTWKKRTRFEVSRKMLGLAKKFCNEIQQSRYPWGYSGEADSRPRQEHETPEEAAALDERYARLKRLHPASETIKDLLQAAWEAEAVLGQDLSQHTNAFIRVHNKIVMAIEERYMQSKGAKMSRDDFRETMRTIYGPVKRDDSITTMLDNATDALQRALKRYI